MKIEVVGPNPEFVSKVFTSSGKDWFLVQVNTLEKYPEYRFGSESEATWLGLYKKV